MSRRARAGAAAIWAAIAALGTARAGDWHGLSDAVCSDCHTMHNSENGRPMRYDQAEVPSPGLLRDATALQLCLHCHDGTDRNAPDVLGPVGYLADPAGGWFSPPGVETPNGHDLGGASAHVPPGGTQPMVLTCTSCHAPHGNAAYRNLVAGPSGAGAVPAPAVNQKVRANGSNPADVYAPSNLVDKGGMSAWCGDCHGDFHGRSAAEEGTGSPWLRHPQDESIAARRGADGSFWLGPQPNRVRVQSPSDELVPSADDQVFCLSCHKAHGSANRASLVFADGATRRSTCQQCHNE